MYRRKTTNHTNRKPKHLPLRHKCIDEKVTHIVPVPAPWTLQYECAGAQTIVVPQGARVLKLSSDPLSQVLHTNSPFLPVLFHKHSVGIVSEFVFPQQIRCCCVLLVFSIFRLNCSLARHFKLNRNVKFFTLPPLLSLFSQIQIY